MQMAIGDGTEESRENGDNKCRPVLTSPRVLSRQSYCREQPHKNHARLTLLYSSATVSIQFPTGCMATVRLTHSKARNIAPTASYI